SFSCHLALLFPFRWTQRRFVVAPLRSSADTQRIRLLLLSPLKRRTLRSATQKRFNERQERKVIHSLDPLLRATRAMLPVTTTFLRQPAGLLEPFIIGYAFKKDGGAYVGLIGFFHAQSLPFPCAYARCKCTCLSNGMSRPLVAISVDTKHLAAVLNGGADKVQ